MRLEDWPARLTAVFEAARRTGFAYSVHDCLIHVTDCVEAVTGRDIAGDWRGRYASLAGGLKLIGVRSISQGVDRYFARVSPAFAQRGDIGLAAVGAPRGSRRELGLVVVDGPWLRGPCGDAAPRGLMVRAWRVE